MLRREIKEIGNKRECSYNEYMCIYTLLLIHANSKEHGNNRIRVISSTKV